MQIRGCHQWIVSAAVLLQWADSIHADHLTVRPINGRSYVYAGGLLVGGRPVRVWTTVDGFAEYLHTSSPTHVELSQLRDFIAEEGDR